MGGGISALCSGTIVLSGTGSEPGERAVFSWEDDIQAGAACRSCHFCWAAERAWGGHRVGVISGAAALAGVGIGLVWRRMKIVARRNASSAWRHRADGLV